jgi:sec-independent protein translocase protein TatA
MFGLGPTELIIVAIIVLLIFGAKRLPEIGKGMGGAIKEFKKVKKEISSGDTDAEMHEEEKPDQKDQTNNPFSLESKMKDKAMEQMPGVRKAMDVKKKADQIKKFIQ